MTTTDRLECHVIIFATYIPSLFLLSVVETHSYFSIMSDKEATQLASKLGISVQKYAQSVSNLEKMLPKFDNAHGGAMR